MEENKDYLTKQIITYLGNKRKLLSFIQRPLEQIYNELGPLKVCDLFAGSGVVSRFLKKYSKYQIANDLELYSYIINKCYLNINKDLDIKIPELELKEGFITKLYSPKDESNITEQDRVFYTRRNAMFLDTVRQYINTLDPDMQCYYIAPLLYLASVNVNTSGIFKGFHKSNGIGCFGGSKLQCLERILRPMEFPKLVYSNFNNKVDVFKEDANKLVKDLESLDVIYLDPPYNQHSYSSNYFMLNLIAEYKEPTNISKVSGIPESRNYSVFNIKKQAEDSLLELINNIKAKYIIMSYNNEGFISDNFKNKVQKIGSLSILEQDYHAFRGSRNLSSRPLKVKEQLYIINKHKGK